MCRGRSAGPSLAASVWPRRLGRGGQRVESTTRAVGRGQDHTDEARTVAHTLDEGDLFLAGIGRRLYPGDVLHVLRGCSFATELAAHSDEHSRLQPQEQVTSQTAIARNDTVWVSLMAARPN
jgi:hypothetical protein